MRSFPTSLEVSMFLGFELVLDLSCSNRIENPVSGGADSLMQMSQLALRPCCRPGVQELVEWGQPLTTSSGMRECWLWIGKQTGEVHGTYRKPAWHWFQPRSSSFLVQIPYHVQLYCCPVGFVKWSCPSQLVLFLSSSWFEWFCPLEGRLFINFTPIQSWNSLL